ncbi:MAG: hypothetical protein NPIRA06_11670 [Nitrospirales bacterium]|nr:MAG: hypothetical protein NPIRA06_11670 [Nitrospirales bacterium]
MLTRMIVILLSFKQNSAVYHIFWGEVGATDTEILERHISRNYLIRKDNAAYSPFQRRNTKQALTPPNPNALEMATSTVQDLA